MIVSFNVMMSQNFKRINDNHRRQKLISLFFFFLNVNVWFIFVVKIKEFEQVKTT